MAFILAEICARPASPLCDRGWQCIVRIDRFWQVRRNKGTMWKPIKRLMAKAQYVREMQKAATTKLNRQWQSDHDRSTSFPPDGSRASSTPTLSTSMSNSPRTFSNTEDNDIAEDGLFQPDDATTSSLAKQLNPFSTDFLSGPGPILENNGLMLNQDGGLSSLMDYRMEDWINFDNTEEMNSVMRFSTLM